MSAQKRSGQRGGSPPASRKGSLARPAGKPAVPPAAPGDSPEPVAPRNHRELAEAIAAKCDLVEVGCDLLEAESESVKARVFETLADWRYGKPAAAASGGPAGRGVRIIWDMPRPPYEIDSN